MRRKNFSGLEQSRKVSGVRTSGLPRGACVGSGLENRVENKGMDTAKLEASEPGLLAPVTTLMPFPVIAQALW